MMTRVGWVSAAPPLGPAQPASLPPISRPTADAVVGRATAAVFDCRGLDQKGKLLELRIPRANRRAFDAIHDAPRRIGLRLAFYP
jgi:hypothetical protein